MHTHDKSRVRVTVKEIKTGKVVRVVGTMRERKAERVERGLLRNINTEDYYVDVEPVDTGRAK